MGKVFILLQIHVITSRRMQRRRGGGDCSKHVNGKINYQLQKFTPLGLISVCDRTVFCTARGGGKTAGCNAPGAFLVIFMVVTCPRLPSTKQICVANFQS